MKETMHKSFMVLLVVLTTVGFAQQSYDYKTMKMDEYRAELAKWQKREADAKAAIAEQQARCEQIKQQISQVEQNTNAVWDEIYALLETDANGYKDYLAQLRNLENEVSGFAALSPEDIYTRKDELEGYKNRLAEMKKDKRSVSSEASGIIQRIENMLAEAEQKAKPAAAGRYEVQRGDYLWKIAKNPDIYGDPYAWIRIYTANRDQIKNPDLIYPNQVFRIPRMAGPNEYWVQRGDYLYKIAGLPNVYGNPFQWQRLYEANKDVISDPNLIYPHMILVVPQ